MGFKTNKKTGQVFNDDKKRSDKHHGSVKPKTGIRMDSKTNGMERKRGFNIYGWGQQGEEKEAEKTIKDEVSKMSNEEKKKELEKLQRTGVYNLNEYGIRMMSELEKYLGTEQQFVDEILSYDISSKKPRNYGTLRQGYHSDKDGNYHSWIELKDIKKKWNELDPSFREEILQQIHIKGNFKNLSFDELPLSVQKAYVKDRVEFINGERGFQLLS